MVNFPQLFMRTPQQSPARSRPHEALIWQLVSGYLTEFAERDNVAKVWFLSRPSLVWCWIQGRVDGDWVCLETTGVFLAFSVCVCLYCLRFNRQMYYNVGNRWVRVGMAFCSPNRNAVKFNIYLRFALQLPYNWLSTQLIKFEGVLWHFSLSVDICG